MVFLSHCLPVSEPPNEEIQFLSLGNAISPLGWLMERKNPRQVRGTYYLCALFKYYGDIDLGVAVADEPPVVVQFVSTLLGN